MKIKKSKIIVPALGLLLLSTAASVTGSVAWFTANKTYQMTAGNFAVVSTKDNLECTLTGQIGTYVDNANKSVSVGVETPVATWDDDSARGTAVAALQAADVGKVYKQADTGKYYVCTGAGKVSEALDNPYVLTDASFDHTDLTAPSIIVPDGDGAKVAKKPSALAAVDVLTDTTGIVRERGKSGVVFSAFTWDMTFKVSFSSGASNKVGLYLDTSSANTWMKKHDDTALGSTDHDTGYGFRIAFVPKTVPAGSLATTKVWADNQTTAECKFVDGLAVDVALAGTAFDGTTYAAQRSSTGLAASTATSLQALSSSDNKNNAGVPANGTDASTDIFTTSTGFGLAYFAPNAGSYTEITYTCVAYYEGTDKTIVNNSQTIYQIMKTSMVFGTSTLTD